MKTGGQKKIDSEMCSGLYLVLHGLFYVQFVYF